MNQKKYLGRREFLGLLTSGAALCPFAGMLTAQGVGRSKEMLLYIGTYTSGESSSEGIYIQKFDPATGRLSPHKTVSGVEDPSFLTIDRNRKFLYTVNETLEHEGQKSGAVSAFSIDRKTGSLSFLNKQSSRGGAPCHISVSRDGKFVLVANYVGGNVAVLPVKADGSLGPAVDLEQHAGTGPDKTRQEAAHAHSIMLDAENKYAFVNDLGIDRIMIYEFDSKNGKLAPNPKQPFYQCRPGAGPRHFKFHPGGKYAFAVNELDMTVSSLSYDQSNGTLKDIQTISTVPAGFSGENTCADIHISPDGRFLYTSNRGHDSIAAYRIERMSGRLEFIEHVSTQGKTPRNFAIDPSGAFMLVANQRSDSIVTFSIDPKSGRLKNTGQAISVPSPVCLQLI